MLNEKLHTHIPEKKNYACINAILYMNYEFAISKWFVCMNAKLSLKFGAAGAVK